MTLLLPCFSTTCACQAQCVRWAVVVSALLARHPEVQSGTLWYAVQVDCTSTDSPELRELADTSQERQMSIPFRSQIELAEPLFASLLQRLEQQEIAVSPGGAASSEEFDTVSGADIDGVFSTPSRMVDPASNTEAKDVND